MKQNSHRVGQPMMPLLSLCAFSERHSCSESLLTLMETTDVAHATKLREDSHWVLDWLEFEVPGGKGVAGRFRDNEKAERLYAFLLDSLPQNRLDELIFKAHEIRAHPLEYRMERRVLHGQKTILPKISPPIAPLADLIENRTATTFRWCCAKATSYLSYFHMYHDKESLVETLLYLTAWANCPGSNSGNKEIVRFKPEALKDGLKNPLPS